MRRPVLLLLWFASDLALFVGAYVLAYFIRVGWILSSDVPVRQFLQVVAVAAPIWLLALITTRAFALTRSQTAVRNLAYVAYACVIGTALVALTYYFVHQQVFSRLILLLGFIGSTVAIWLWHILFDHLQRGVLRRSPPAFPTLIIGVTRESRGLIGLLQRHRNPLTPVAILDAAGSKETAIDGVPVKGKLHKLEDILREDRITHLIQCSDLEQSMNLLSACRARGITYMLLPSVLGIVERDETIETLEGKAVTMVAPPRSWWQWFFR